MPKRTDRTLDEVTARRIDRLFDDIDRGIQNNDSATVVARTGDLWEVRDLAGEVILDRLVAGRAAFPHVVLETLQGFLGEDSLPYLERIAGHADAPGGARIAARRSLGWPESGEAKRRREFLATLPDPDEALIAAVTEAMGSWPPEFGLLEEVLGYVSALPPDRRRHFVQLLIDDVGQPALFVLHGILHIRDAEAPRMALTQLVEWGAAASAAPLGRLATTARSKALRQEAADAASRIEEATREKPAGDFPPIDRALLSQLDGDGGQVVFILRGLTAGAAMFIDIFHNELVGIKGVICRQSMPIDEIDEILEDFTEVELDLIEVDPAAARGALALATTVNGERGKAIPPAFEICAPFLHDSIPAAPEESIIYPELDDAPYADHVDLIAESDELFGHVWFSSWNIPVPTALDVMEEVPPPSGGRLTDREYRALIPRFFTPQFIPTLRSRLRRQAWLLEQEGETADRDRALAASVSLAAISERELIDHPFVRTMTRQSVENAIAALWWDEVGF